MTSPFYNPSIRQVPRSAKAPILQSSTDSSILTWLEEIGRLRAREPVEVIPDEPDSEEISDLMGNDDSYDDDDDLPIEDDD
ncbi:MAG: DUF3134 domain-containing protein [Cyanobacteria bacterium Co-bin13]|nr:DUF3134 domain-containing protein [Cyanobacteria bacterium Co-bin13]